MNAITQTSDASSLTDFTIAFVSFATLLGTALLAPEATMDLGFYRTVYTIWATTALVTPALCAFALPGNSPRKERIWLLFWTFSFIAYLVHMSYAIFSVYHGSFKEFLDGQGLFPAIVNVIFTVWWLLDLTLAWLLQSEAKWIQIERIAAHIFIGLTFFTSTIILKHGFINVLGGLMTASVLICLMVRFDSRKESTFIAREADM